MTQKNTLVGFIDKTDYIDFKVKLNVLHTITD